MRKLAYFGLAAFIASVPLQMAYYEMQVYAGSIPRLIGYGAFILGIAGILYHSRVRSISRIHVVAIAFILWECLSYAWSIDPASSWSRIITWAQLAVMVILISQYAQTDREVGGLRLAFVLGCFLPIFQVIRNYFAGSALSGMNVYSMQYARFGAFSEDPNELALGLVIGIPLAWYIFLNRKDWVRWIGFFYIPFCLTAVGLTGSRGGTAAGIVALLIVPLTIRRLDAVSRVAALVGAVAGLAFFIIVVPETTKDRLILALEFLAQSRQYAKADILDLDIRVTIWLAGLKVFAQNPLAGVGAAAYSAAIPSFGGEAYSGHSAWIQVLVETGLVGLGLWLSVVVMCFRSIRLLPKKERVMWYCALGAWMIGSSFIGNEYNKDTWMLLSLIAARSVSALEERRQRRLVARAGRITMMSPSRPPALVSA